MLNSALFGGIEARVALQDSMFDPEQEDIGIDWCVGSCPHWRDTEEGRGRMQMLRDKFETWGQEHPKEYAELRAKQRRQDDARETTA